MPLFIPAEKTANFNKVVEKIRKTPRNTNYNLYAFGFDKRNRLISFGVNSYVKTHPQQRKFAHKAGKDFKFFLHAEIHCIVKARKAIHELLVIRLNKKGQVRLAMPCEICQLAIKHAGIKIVRYSI